MRWKQAKCPPYLHKSRKQTISSGSLNSLTSFVLFVGFGLGGGGGGGGVLKVERLSESLHSCPNPVRGIFDYPLKKKNCYEAELKRQEGMQQFKVCFFHGGPPFVNFCFWSDQGGDDAIQAKHPVWKWHKCFLFIAFLCKKRPTLTETRSVKVYDAATISVFDNAFLQCCWSV